MRPAWAAPGHTPQMMKREVGRAGVDAGPQNLLEVDGSNHPPNRLARSVARHDGRPASETEALAALGTPGVDHGAAAARLHPDEEAVSAGTTDLGGLIGAFHV